jgi:uncharacterized cupin superfamily protein/uncharacterized glyoxalase superfamily protein PhnB
MPARPDFIRHWAELEYAQAHHYPDSDERMAFWSSLGEKLGLTRIGIHHLRVPPGRRISYPHAESAEEEFVFVLEGQPDAWIDGVLHRLVPGDSVAFPAGTGICHTFMNNTGSEVRLLVVGESSKVENRIHYPLNPEYAAKRADRWTDPPVRALGPHDGHPRFEPWSADAAKVPIGWHALTTRIVTDDVEGLVAFVKRTFDATGDIVSGRPCELAIGDAWLMVSAAEARAPFPAFLYVYVGDVDAVYRRALDAGAKSLEPPQDMPYGDRRAMVEDAWSNVWQIATYGAR